MTRLELLRRRRAWTQMELAYRARLTQGRISRLERRQDTPWPNESKRLGAVLGVPPETLLDDLTLNVTVVEANRG